MAEDNEKAFAFDPFDPFTVVITTPVGVEVRQAKYAELDDLDVPEPGPGITVEVIPPPREDGTARGGVSLEAGQSVADVAKRVTSNENRRRKDAAEREAEPVTEAGGATAGPGPVSAPEPEVSEQPKRETAKKAETRSGPKASTGPVGPDPKQEAARSRSVAGPTGATGRKR